MTIGWPLDGWEVAVVDETGEPVPLGETGELIIGGVGLGRYLDRELDAERYARCPRFRGARLPHRRHRARDRHGLEFVGRRDHQVKIAGRRVELGEIDAQLRA